MQVRSPLDFVAFAAAGIVDGYQTQNGECLQETVTSLEWQRIHCEDGLLWSP